MKKSSARALALAAVFLLLFETLAFAAARLSTVRFHSGRTHDRAVFDLTEMPKYTVKEDVTGRELTIDFKATASGFRREDFSGKRIESVSYKLKSDHVLVTIRFKPGMKYKVGTLKSPARVFVDFELDNSPSGTSAAGTSGTQKKEETVKYPVIEEAMMAPGLTRTKYVDKDADGLITAYFLEADPSKYRLEAALARGVIPGRETLSGISDRYQAVAAVNASYFAQTGDLLGVTKIDGLTAGTTYIERSAVGIGEDGALRFGKVSYEGTVRLGKVEEPIGGVNCERGEDMLVVYNRLYGKTTKTNEYGREYVIEDGRVVQIVEGGNAYIPVDGAVVSVHGAMKDAFKNTKAGAKAKIDEEIEGGWDDYPTLVGAGPRLLTNGRVTVTADEEEFPSDIRVGRAPRTAVAVKKDGTLMLAVVDGRQKISHGLTLTEWAALIKSRGAVDALNLDGGGSSEMVIGGEIQNSPSDGSERPIGSALILTEK